MSNRERFYMCGAKKRHSTEEIAKAERISLLKANKAAKVNVYLCPYCHYYHLGRDKEYE
jgi:hypothetical protein